MKKIARKDLKAAADEMGLKTTVKGKPVSNEKLLEIVKAGMEDHQDDDGKYEIEVLADIAAAEDAGKEIVVVGDDPSIPKKIGKKEAAVKEEEDDDATDDEDEEVEVPAKKAKKKASKPVAEEEEEEEEVPVKKAKKKKSSDEDAPAKKAKKPAAEKKEKAPTDAWGSREGSSAFRINKVLFSHKKKGITMQDIHAIVSEEDDTITKDRINAHLRRLWKTSNLIERDAKDRYRPVA